MPKTFGKQIRRPLEPIIFYGTLTVIGLTAAPFGTVDPFWESLFEVAVFGLTILWLIDGLHSGLWWQRDHLLLIPLFALVLFALVQSVSYATSNSTVSLGGMSVNEAISADPFETRRFSLKLLAVSLTLGLLLRYTSNLRRVRFLMYMIIGVAVGSALFGLLRDQLFGFDFLRERLSSASSYAQFDNRNHFAFLMEAAIGLLMGLAIAEWRRLKRLSIYLLMGAVMWSALLFTQSRGAVVSLITEVIVFCLLLTSMRVSFWRMKNRNGFRRLTAQLIVGVMIVMLVTGVVGASITLVGGDEMVRRFELTPSEFSNDQAGSMKLLRPQIWRATLGMIKDNPLIGTGFGAFSIAIPRHLNASGEWTPEQAHNDYLELLAGGGVIGVLPALWLVLIFIRMVRSRIQQASNSELVIRCGALAGLSGIAIHSMFDFGLHVTINTLVCVALIVLAVKAFDTNLTNGSVKTQAA